MIKMSNIHLEEQVKESFFQQQLMDMKIESALKIITNTNPVERMLKQIDPCDEALRKHCEQYTRIMMQTWIESYSDFLEKSKNIPGELMGEAMDLAKRLREKNQSDTSK